MKSLAVGSKLIVVLIGCCTRVWNMLKAHTVTGLEIVLIFFRPYTCPCVSLCRLWCYLVFFCSGKNGYLSTSAPLPEEGLSVPSPPHAVPPPADYLPGSASPLKQPQGSYPLPMPVPLWGPLVLHFATRCPPVDVVDPPRPKTALGGHGHWPGSVRGLQGGDWGYLQGRGCEGFLQGHVGVLLGVQRGVPLLCTLRAN